MISRFLRGCFLFSVMASAHGQSSSMLEYVQEQALEADRAFKANPDPSIVSARVMADGKAIVYTYVINFRSDVSESSMDLWRRATWSEVVPHACALIKRAPYYQEGLQLVYRYLDTRNRLRGEFSADKNSCAKL